MYKTLKALSLFIGSATLTLLIFHLFTIALILNDTGNHSIQYKPNIVGSN